MRLAALDLPSYGCRHKELMGVQGRAQGRLEANRDLRWRDRVPHRRTPHAAGCRRQRRPRVAANMLKPALARGQKLVRRGNDACLVPQACRRARPAGTAVPDRPSRPAVLPEHDHLAARVEGDLRDPAICTLPRQHAGRGRATQDWIHLSQGATWRLQLIRTPTTISYNPNGRALRILCHFGRLWAVLRGGLPAGVLAALHFRQRRSRPVASNLLVRRG